MKSDQRHYTEEELLLHLLGENGPEVTAATAGHLDSCAECASVLRSYSEFQRELLRWRVDEPGEDWWQDSKGRLLQELRDDSRSARARTHFEALKRMMNSAWEYALENPLPTMGYVVAVLAFASERTITLFRLDRLLPRTSEMLEILRQVL
jgi:hypothetical protein